MGLKLSHPPKFQATTKEPVDSYKGGHLFCRPLEHAQGRATFAGQPGISGMVAPRGGGLRVAVRLITTGNPPLGPWNAKKRLTWVLRQGQGYAKERGS